MLLNNKENYKFRNYDETVLTFLNANYYLEDKTIILLGDGAPWIKSLADQIHAEFVLDEFHLKKLLHNCFNFRRRKRNKRELILTKEEKDKKAIYEDMCAFIKNGDVESCLGYLKPLLSYKYQKQMPFLKKKKGQIKDLIKYIKNNEIGIKNYQKEYYIGSQTESQISHNVKALKSYGAKAYSRLTFLNMLNMRMAKVNGWDPLEILIADYEHEIEQTKEYFYQNIWYKDNDVNYEPKQGGVPILKASNKGLAKIIRNILNSKN